MMSLTIPGVLKWDDGAVHSEPDELAEEAPLEIRVNHRSVSVTMRTPGHDAELAAGFLLTEGIIQGAADLLLVKHCQRNRFGNVLNVELSPHVDFDFSRLTRHVFAGSSCGLCGKATIDAIASQFPPVTSDVRFPARVVVQFPEKMHAVQKTFERTGGLHAAALLDEVGQLVVVREDIGRHNAVDKVLGYCLLHGRFPLERFALMVSGRSSFEIMQKALSAGIPLVAAVSAPSSLAVDFARNSGQTLIGFLRDRRMNVYTRPDRVAFGRE